MSGTTEQIYFKIEKVRLNWFTRFMNKLFPEIIYATLGEEPFTKGEIVIEAHWSNDQIVFYKGNCTVWHTYPMMERCDTSLESKLSNIWSYFKTHGSPYPTAHETRK